MTSLKKLDLDHLIGKEVGTVTILKELARGGDAVVFIGFQRTLRRQIALKVLPKSLLTRETSERFQQEAESVAILSHPNIIQIYEVGETPDFLFFAMQLVQGRSLADYLNAARKHVLPSRRILPIQATADILIKVLDALDYAHSQGFVHRDIKPGNILIETRSKRPIVVDFGIAKLSHDPENENGIIQGTPVYMPPEQIMNQPIDARSDIYATGVMMFEMLVSNLPIPAWSSPLELLRMKLKMKDDLFQRKPSEINPMVHPELEKIVLKASSFDPERRYATCQEFLKSLETYRERHIKTHS
jgi:eukaryotic-like serine/threonine-protein kinase